nr:S-protein homolog 18-like [Solanum lycopersicum]
MDFLLVLDFMKYYICILGVAKIKKKITTKQSTMSLIKNFCILLLTLYIVSITPEATKVDSDARFEVHIINDLPDNNIPLWIHCKSKTHDFGNRLLKVEDDFTFWFKLNLFETNLYFSHFWWGKKHNVFDVYNRHLKKYCAKPQPTTDIRTCYWKVQEDGFYLGANADITEKMHDWL